jgi:hypothetical protein
MQTVERVCQRLKIWARHQLTPVSSVQRICRMKGWCSEAESKVVKKSKESGMETRKALHAYRAALISSHLQQILVFKPSRH